MSQSQDAAAHAWIWADPSSVLDGAVLFDLRDTAFFDAQLAVGR